MNTKKQIMILLLIFLTTLYLFSSKPVFSDDLNFEEDFLEVFTSIQNNIAFESSNSESTLNLNSHAYVVIDRLSQQILYGKNESSIVKMASTTKIMTAIVVIENADLSTTVEVSRKAAGTGGSRLGLKVGDKITIKDLLYGLMLSSGNDAAVSLAESVGGSIDGFSKLMNQKALELGLQNTNFESPHGLDSENHYTTAYELALLSNYALQNKEFSQIVGTKNYTATLNGYPKNISNTNELLGNLNGVYGVKTGFTNGANRCLVSACKRGDMDIICVVLGADTKNFRTQDSIKLIEYTFNNFEYVNLQNLINDKVKDWKNENEMKNPFNINKGASNKIEFNIENLETPIIPLSKEIIQNIEIQISMTTNLIAPVVQNTIIGNINIIIDETNTISLDILSSNSIEKKSTFDYIFEIFKNYPDILVMD